MTVVHLLRTRWDGKKVTQEIGLALDDGGPDGAVRVRATDNPSLAETVLNHRVLEPETQRWLTRADGARWLRALPYHYNGTYLRAALDD